MRVKLRLKRINQVFDPNSLFVGNELAIISYNTRVTKVLLLESAELNSKDVRKFVNN